ncbi:MAG TPA: fumarylacetoacetate hydrolase family protein [Kofleriaceae bacterium]|nr:fumarylacetoacetate hydrolase family protein [Kofleriaceae bacterium]
MHWLRFVHGGVSGFGTLEGDEVRVYRGDMFGAHEATGETLAVAGLTWDTPCAPTKMVALLNNFHAQLAKLGRPVPAEPLYFLKAPNTFAAHGQTIAPPRSYAGRILYEGELGVVIGKTGRDIAPEAVADHIFGYTCVNDLTAFDLFTADPQHEQWTRAKGFDGFGPFGPVIATGLDPSTLTVRTLVNGRERQSYPAADMVFSPAQLVSLISRDMTLVAGDIITCGTSVGVGPLKPGMTVEVAIDGIGVLRNPYGEAAQL